MSSTYNPTATSADAHSSQELDNGLGLNNNLPSAPYDNYQHLSPYNPSQIYSSSASPSNTPDDSGYSNYQPSEFSEVEDPFFGVNFDDGVQRVDSFTATLAGTTTYQTLLNRRPTDPPVRARAQPTSATTSYPLSPSQSIARTPSPRAVITDSKGQTTISQHELITELHKSSFQTVNPLAPVRSAALQPTPDLSGSSHTSAEGIEPSSMAPHPERSPPIRIFEWGNNQEQDQLRELGASGGQQSMNTNTFGGELPAHIPRNDEGDWRSKDTNGPAGIGPEERHGLDGEVLSPKEQEALRYLDYIKSEVEEWRSQAGGSEAGDETPSPSYFPPNDEWSQERAQSSRMNGIDEIPNIVPLDDEVAAVHENQLKGGHTYFKPENAHINKVDRDLLIQPRHWNDAPSYPFATTTQFQPKTSQEAMIRFLRRADSISQASRAGTWGSRRRSEPSLADWESVQDGSFLKKLSISRSSGTRKDSLFDQGLDRLAKFTRKRSDAAKLKRARSSQNIPEENQQPPNPRQNSQGSLAPPSRSGSFGKRNQTPSIGTQIAAMAGPLTAVGTIHARSGSISASVASPKSPGHLGFLNRTINRARSKSDLSGAAREQPGLVGLWRGHGGPPVATLAAPHVQAEVKKPEIKKTEKRQIDTDDEDEEDDDEAAEEGDMKADAEVDPIVPNYEGFKAHVRRLNTDIKPQHNWLVSRIAHQQEFRYKNLLELRVKHSQAISIRNCAAGTRCLALGGTVMLLDAKGNPRDSDRKTPGLQIQTDFGSDDDSNPGEGVLSDESFPAGVLMPPTRNLPAEFECQLCFKPKKFYKPSDWTKHVHEDVQPFTCTYEKCKEPKSFKRKADWVRHENERHRHLEWWICQVDDCRHICYRKDNFLQHLVREHKLPEPKLKTKAAQNKARTTEPAWRMLEQCHHETTNRPQEEPCKFCGKSFPTWKKLTVHLAKHMENISLPILRLVENKDVDASTIISPVREQLLTPVTPAGYGAKTEAHSPFNMDSISPHIPDQQWSGQLYAPHNAAMFDQYADVGVTTDGRRAVAMDPNGRYQGEGFGPNNSGHHSVNGEPHGAMGFAVNRGAANAFHTQPYFSQSSGPPSSFAAQAQIPQAVQFGQNVYPTQRAYGSLDSSSIGQTRSFEQTEDDFTQPKIEQFRGFGSLDAGFAHGMTTQNLNQHQTPAYTMAGAFSAAPAVSGYQSPNMLSISNPGFGYDENGQPFTQVPMSRAQGSAQSSYHSPQHVPYYGP